MPQSPRPRYQSSSTQRRQAPGRPQQRRQEPRRDASSALDAALAAAAALPEPPEASFAELNEALKRRVEASTPGPDIAPDN